MGEEWTDFITTSSICMRKLTAYQMDSNFLSFPNNLQMEFDKSIEFCSALKNLLLVKGNIKYIKDQIHIIVDIGFVPDLLIE